MSLRRWKRMQMLSTLINVLQRSTPAVSIHWKHHLYQQLFLLIKIWPKSLPLIFAITLLTELTLSSDFSMAEGSWLEMWNRARMNYVTLRWRHTFWIGNQTRFIATNVKDVVSKSDQSQTSNCVTSTQLVMMHLSQMLQLMHVYRDVGALLCHWAEAMLQSLICYPMFVLHKSMSRSQMGLSSIRQSVGSLLYEHHNDSNTTAAHSSVLLDIHFIDWKIYAWTDPKDKSQCWRSRISTMVFFLFVCFNQTFGLVLSLLCWGWLVYLIPLKHLNGFHSLRGVVKWQYLRLRWSSQTPPIRQRPLSPSCWISPPVSRTHLPLWCRPAPTHLNSKPSSAEFVCSLPPSLQPSLPWSLNEPHEEESKMGEKNQWRLWISTGILPNACSTPIAQCHKQNPIEG